MAPIQQLFADFNFNYYYLDHQKMLQDKLRTEYNNHNQLSDQMKKELELLNEVKVNKMNATDRKKLFDKYKSKYNLRANATRMAITDKIKEKRTSLNNYKQELMKIHSGLKIIV